MSSSVRFTMRTNRRTVREIRSSTPRSRIFVIRDRTRSLLVTTKRSADRKPKAPGSGRLRACMFARDDRRQRCQYQPIIAIHRTAVKPAAIAVPIGSIWIFRNCPSAIGSRHSATRCAGMSSAVMSSHLHRRHSWPRSMCGRPAPWALPTSQQLLSILFTTRPISVRKMTASSFNSWNVGQLTSLRKVRRSRPEQEKPSFSTAERQAAC